MLTVLEPHTCKFFSAVVADANRTSTAIDLMKYNFAAFQLVWASLTGSVDATFKVQVSNDNTNWADRGSATTLSGASGNAVIVVGDLAERYARVVFTKNSVSGGTLTGYCSAKG